MRKLDIIGDIDFENFKEFSELLDALESKNSGQPISIHLASHGGDAHAALAYAARIRLSKCEIIITALGNVASAAIMILAAGDRRIMTSESWAMVHEEQGTGTYDS